jgi:hypothetical protein
MATYEIGTRSIPERRLAAISRHLHADETDAFFTDAFARLRSVGPGPGGDRRLPVPYIIFYGEVSDDSDGPVELCRPLAPPAEGSTEVWPGIEVSVEAAPEEAFVPGAEGHGLASDAAGRRRPRGVGETAAPGARWAATPGADRRPAQRYAGQLGLRPDPPFEVSRAATCLNQHSTSFRYLRLGPQGSP